jgi:hypothetical protein
MVVKLGEFKGNNVISLLKESKDGEEDKFPFTFGLNKAKLILENLDDIKKFVEENSRQE